MPSFPVEQKVDKKIPRRRIKLTAFSCYILQGNFLKIKISEITRSGDFFNFKPSAPGAKYLASFMVKELVPGAPDL
jgi:hypothetical protein